MIFLIPPSEGKKQGGQFFESVHSRQFETNFPNTIAVNATMNDLKCKGKRFEEGIALNTDLGSKDIKDQFLMPAIHRYTGVMYNAIGYASMNESSKKRFNDHALIVSGYYGLLNPQDLIANYKLPMGTTGLYEFWGTRLIEAIDDLGEDVIIDLLPGAYKKVFNFGSKESSMKTKVIHVDFFENKKKLTHGVKGVKGAWIRMICEAGVESLHEGEFSYKNTTVTVVFS